MPGIRNRYLPALANQWASPQSFCNGYVSLGMNNDQPTVLFNLGGVPGSPNISSTAGDSLPGFVTGKGQWLSNSQTGDVAYAYANRLLIGPHSGYGIQYGVTPSALSPAIASGTVYQNTTASYQTIDIPCYASTAGTAGPVAVAYGSSSTPSTIYTQYVSGSTSSTAQAVIHLRVPRQWYYELTATGVTLGTPTMIQE